MGGDLAPSLGGTEKNSREKFPNDLFRKEFTSFNAQKFLMTFFLKYGNITVDPFPDQKLLTTQNSSGRPFSVSSFFASHPITVLLEIFRGTDAWAEFGGDRPANTP